MKTTESFASSRPSAADPSMSSTARAPLPATGAVRWTAKPLSANEVALPPSALAIYRKAEAAANAARAAEHAPACRCWRCRLERMVTSPQGRNFFYSALAVPTIAMFVALGFRMPSLAAYFGVSVSVVFDAMFGIVVLSEVARPRDADRTWAEVADYLIRLDAVHPAIALLKMKRPSGQKKVRASSTLQKSLMSVDPDSPAWFIRENTEWYFNAISEALACAPSRDITSALRLGQEPLDAAASIGSTLHDLTAEQAHDWDELRLLKRSKRNTLPTLEARSGHQPDGDSDRLNALFARARRRSEILRALPARCLTTHADLTRALKDGEQSLSGHENTHFATALRRRITTLRESLAALDAVRANAEAFAPAFDETVDIIGRLRKDNGLSDDDIYEGLPA